MQGASTLADVLKLNTTLQELYCENNGIPLQGFTDLINALHRNTTLLYLPSMQESRNAALKATENQVKQIRDETAVNTQTKSASMRNKLSSKVYGRPTSKSAASFGLSDQDIKAALGLVDESWERQEYRLQQYLQRNYNLANNIPTTMEVNDEEFERPATATSLGRLVEKVKLDSTPTGEKDIELGNPIIHDTGGKDIELGNPIIHDTGEKNFQLGNSIIHDTGEKNIELGNPIIHENVFEATELEDDDDMSFAQDYVTWTRQRLPSG